LGDERSTSYRRGKDSAVKLRLVGDYLVYFLVRVLLCVVQAMTLETCDKIAWGLARLFCSVLKIRRRVVEDNISTAYPGLSSAQRHQMALEMWRHLFLMVMEIAHARRKINRVNWRKHLRLGNDEQLVRACLTDRPPVIVTGHFGNFEIGGYLMGLFGFPTVTVARTLDNIFLDRFLNEFRQSTGQYMVEKNGTADRLARMQQRGAKLCLLGDQAAGKKGCWVDFFGRPASTHKAIALFSLGNNNPMLISYTYRVGGPLQYESGMTALADPLAADFQMNTVPVFTQWFSTELEKVIRRAPEQYWWVHRRWKGEPPAVKKLARKLTDQSSQIQDEAA
jgi:KDO2-lipid IV(A) lauroyltransferase